MEENNFCKICNLKSDKINNAIKKSGILEKKKKKLSK